MGEITLMAGTNDFKAFATDANANVTSQEEWETLTALKKGFSSGKASSAQVSKALRQPSTMAAVLGQFIANAELDALDDGDVDGLVAKLATAITTNLGLGELSLAGTASGVIGLNGYVTIPLIISGSRRTLIIQWGQARFGGSGGEDAGYLNDFPFAFPSACYGMIVSHVGHTPSGAGILSASAITSNQFRGFSSIATAANAVLGRYIAIGV
ncbi:gp53-like domain-containing protein [Escherichia coli]